LEMVQARAAERIMDDARKFEEDYLSKLNGSQVISYERFVEYISVEALHKFRLRACSMLLTFLSFVMERFVNAQRTT
jgi:hypothetical protein